MDVGQGAEQLIHVQLDIRHRDRLKLNKNILTQLTGHLLAFRRPTEQPDQNDVKQKRIFFFTRNQKIGYLYDKRTKT